MKKLILIFTSFLLLSVQAYANDDDTTAYITIFPNSWGGSTALHFASIPSVNSATKTPYEVIINEANPRSLSIWGIDSQGTRVSCTLSDTDLGGSAAASLDIMIPAYKTFLSVVSTTIVSISTYIMPTGLCNGANLSGGVSSL